MASDDWWKDLSRVWSKYQPVPVYDPRGQNRVPQKTLPPGKVAPGEEPDGASIFDVILKAANLRKCVRIVYNGESKIVEPRNWTVEGFFYGVCHGSHRTAKNAGVSKHFASFIQARISSVEILYEMPFRELGPPHDYIGPGFAKVIK